jgi:hypothetical protein
MSNPGQRPFDDLMKYTVWAVSQDRETQVVSLIGDPTRRKSPDCAPLLEIRSFLRILYLVVQVGRSAGGWPWLV